MGTLTDLFIFVIIALVAYLIFTVIWMGLNKSMLHVFSRIKKYINQMNLTLRTILNFLINLGAILLGAWLWDNYGFSEILAAVLFGMIMSLVHFLFNQEEAI